jgi:hypothetical protein
VVAWEPPSLPRDPWLVNESCPGCGEPLCTAGRATVRACLTCRCRVIPPGVSAPYQRADVAARQVKSQRERDMEAIALAERKGIMLGQLAEVAGDARLHPASVPIVEWFADQVRAAKTDDRLTELADLLPDAGIRRRHWWQGEPAAIETGGYDQADDDQDGDYEYDDSPGAHGSNLPTELPPVSATSYYADELAVRGYQLGAGGRQGGCQIIETMPTGQPPGSAPVVCGGPGISAIPGGRICPPHYEALQHPMARKAARQ